MYIFYYTINMMVVNAWLRHRSHARLLNQRYMKLADFQASLAIQLVEKKRIGRPSLGSAAKCRPSQFRTSIPSRETRLDNYGHLPDYCAKRGRCKGNGCSGITHSSSEVNVTLSCALTKTKTVFPDSI